MSQHTYTVLPQQADHRGFRLTEPVALQGPISVLVGRNGSGKTRFLESLLDSKFDGFNDKSVNIPTRLFEHQHLEPNFGDAFDVGQHEAAVRKYIKAFAAWKGQGFREPYEHHEEGIEGLSVRDLKKITRIIVKKTAKRIHELTPEDLEFNYDVPPADAFVKFDLSGRINRYVRKLQKNSINAYYRSEGEQVEHLTPEEFQERNGRAPWIVLNETISKIFDGKFAFSEPDVKTKTHDFRVELLEKGQPRNLSELSRGEKILLWLTLLLFQSTTLRQASAFTSIFLFDEPDAFLHPKMVMQMYSVFRTVAKEFDLNIIITTHSPTTAALADEHSLFSVENNLVRPISVDAAVAQLLEGVPHIAIDPTKRRQVYVESFKDVEIYQAIFEEIKDRNKRLNPEISINFIASGPKVPKNLIETAINKNICNLKADELAKIVEMINGVGSCSQVISQVDALISAKNNTARGIVDWDKKHSPGATRGVHVLGHELFYSLENWTLDPLGCLWFLNTIDATKHPLLQELPKVKFEEWRKSPELLQKSLDYMIYQIYGHTNNQDAPINYLNGFTIKSDKRHTESHGHEVVAQLIMNKYPELNKLRNLHRLKDLSCAMVQFFMIHASSGELIPAVVADCLIEIQTDL